MILGVTQAMQEKKKQRVYYRVDGNIVKKTESLRGNPEKTKHKRQ